jgi:gas vesicle protein
MGDNRVARSVLGFCVGVGVGAVLGMVFAPKSGEEMREDISDTAQRGMDAATQQGRKWARRAKAAAGDVADQVTDQVSEAVDSGRQAFEDARSTAARAGRS